MSQIFSAQQARQIYHDECVKKFNHALSQNNLSEHINREIQKSCEKHERIANIDKSLFGEVEKKALEIGFESLGYGFRDNVFSYWIEW